MVPRVQERTAFCETNSTPQRPIEPHEICVKKLLATMMITYYEFHKYYHLVKPQFIKQTLQYTRTAALIIILYFYLESRP